MNMPSLQEGESNPQDSGVCPPSSSVRIVPRSEHPISRKMMDEEVLKVLYRLRNQGQVAYLCGGGVRDLLLGFVPKDFDVATDAHPNRVKRIFSNSWLVGKRFRLVHVVFKSGKVVEVSTFRRETDPEHQEPGREVCDNALLLRRDNTFGTPEEDALRRDFTINALYYNIADFSIIDYVGGLEDLRNGIIRSIGDPDVRFQEDPIRILRGIRFAAHLGFRIEEHTWNQMRIHAPRVLLCPASRIHEDLLRFMRKPGVRRGYEYMEQAGLLSRLLPELQSCRDDSGRLPAEFGNTLDALDAFRAERASEVFTDALLWAVVFYWPVRKHLDGAPGGGDTATRILEFLTPPGVRLNIPKAVRSVTARILFTYWVLFSDPENLRLGKGWLRLYRSPVFEPASMLAHILGWSSGKGDAFWRDFQKALDQHASGRNSFRGGRRFRKEKKRP